MSVKAHPATQHGTHSADSLVLVLTDSAGEKTAGWVLQARYIIRLQRGRVCVSYLDSLPRAVTKTVSVS